MQYSNGPLTVGYVDLFRAIPYYTLLQLHGVMNVGFTGVNLICNEGFPPTRTAEIELRSSKIGPWIPMVVTQESRFMVHVESFFYESLNLIQFIAQKILHVWNIYTMVI